MSINIDFEELPAFFVAKKHLLNRFRDKIIGTKKTRVVYFDNKAPILLVSHVDTVQTPRLESCGMRGAGFDDRLGCYLSYTLQQQRPDLFDVVWCDYEESGRSTGQHFTPSHDYNFIIELDREMDDFVDYDLADSDFLTKFKEVTNIEHGWGSFSDIASMDHIDSTKINLGIGIAQGTNHSPNSRFYPFMCLSQIDKMMKFVELYKNQHWPSGPGWVPYVHKYCSTGVTHYNPYSGNKYNWKTGRYESLNNGLDPNAVYYPCDFCTNPTPNEMYDELADSLICEKCREYLLESGDLEFNPKLDGKASDPYMKYNYDAEYYDLDDNDTECIEMELFDLWANCEDWTAFCYDVDMDPDIIKYGVGNITVKIPIHILLYHNIINYNDLELNG